MTHFRVSIAGDNNNKSSVGSGICWWRNGNIGILIWGHEWIRVDIDVKVHPLEPLLCTFRDRSSSAIIGNHVPSAHVNAGGAIQNIWLEFGIWLSSRLCSVLLSPLRHAPWGRHCHLGQLKAFRGVWSPYPHSIQSNPCQSNSHSLWVNKCVYFAPLSRRCGVWIHISVGCWILLFYIGEAFAKGPLRVLVLSP